MVTPVPTTRGTPTCSTNTTSVASWSACCSHRSKTTWRRPPHIASGSGTERLPFDYAWFTPRSTTRTANVCAHDGRIDWQTASIPVPLMAQRAENASPARRRVVHFRFAVYQRARMPNCAAKDAAASGAPGRPLHCSSPSSAKVAISRWPAGAHPHSAPCPRWPGVPPRRP